MLGQYLLAFREVFEAALITSIILVFFAKTGRKHLNKYVWIGVAIAIATSTIIALFLWFIYGGLSDKNSKLFEGIAGLLAVAVLTSMILWMAIKGQRLKSEIELKVEIASKNKTMIGIVFLAFAVVFREGLETVLFLTPYWIDDLGGTLFGGGLGLLSALAISVGVYKLGIKFDIKKLFYFTSILLILVAAGLAGYAVHELLEYLQLLGIDTGWFGSIAFDLQLDKGSLLHHKGAIGSIFAVMFGYSSKMEWGRIFIHALYLIIFLPLTILVYKKPVKNK